MDYPNVLAIGNHDWTDIAYLYDTGGASTLTAQDGSASLMDSKYSVNVNKFGKAIAVQQTGSDTVQTLSATDYALQTVGSWTSGA